jgi:hypothetical protein
MAYPHSSEGNVKVTLFSELDNKATVTLKHLSLLSCLKKTIVFLGGIN